MSDDRSTPLLLPSTSSSSALARFSPLPAMQSWLTTSTSALSAVWDRFWFTPQDPATLGVIRICVGLLLAYSQLVWALNSEDFFGATSWLNASAVSAIRNDSYAWSPLWWIDDSPMLLGLTHALATISALCLAAGLFTRTSACLSFVFVVSYANRNPAALYGFDQVVGFLSLYLAIGPAGACLSVDDLLTLPRDRHGDQPSIGANVALRLMQSHLCLLYLFAGLAKLKGITWWNGFAMWGTVANLEYQTVDLTWLATWPLLINVLTQVTVFWEVSYCVLIWNRHSRPLMQALAVPVHLGIAICFGMLTFGLSMLVANVAFVRPEQIRRVLRVLTQEPARTPIPPVRTRLHRPEEDLASVA